MSSLWHCWQRRVWRDVVGLDVLCLLLHPVARRRQVRQGVLAAVLQGKNKSFYINVKKLSNGNRRQK